MTRTFEFKPARRVATPVLVGLVGPSGSGKTYTALRLATGMQRITGGEIFGIDTESNRMLHYAGKGPGKFSFRHALFTAPFGPLDYLSVIEQAVKLGAKNIIVDSISHEHEGPGGVLEQHAAETDRLAKAWKVSADKAQMAAWGPPKAARRRLINSLIQLPCNFIFCFRAKEKIKVITGKPPVSQGWMPIAGDEFVFEMTIRALLLPGAGGVPTWTSNEPGEKEIIKMSREFESLKKHVGPLDESVGERLARWARGDIEDKSAPDAPAASNDNIDDDGTLSLEEEARMAAEMEGAR